MPNCYWTIDQKIEYIQWLNVCTWGTEGTESSTSSSSPLYVSTTSNCFAQILVMRNDCFENAAGVAVTANGVQYFNFLI